MFIKLSVIVEVDAGIGTDQYHRLDAEAKYRILDAMQVMTSMVDAGMPDLIKQIEIDSNCKANPKLTVR